MYMHRDMLVLISTKGTRMKFPDYPSNRNADESAKPLLDQWEGAVVE